MTDIFAHQNLSQVHFLFKNLFLTHLCQHFLVPRPPVIRTKFLYKCSWEQKRKLSRQTKVRNILQHWRNMADLCRLTPAGRRLISRINRLMGPYRSLVMMLRTMVLRRARISWWSVGARVPFFSTGKQKALSPLPVCFKGPRLWTLLPLFVWHGLQGWTHHEIRCEVLLLVTHRRSSRGDKEVLRVPGAGWCCPTAAVRTPVYCHETETSGEAAEQKKKKKHISIK